MSKLTRQVVRLSKLTIFIGADFLLIVISLVLAFCLRLGFFLSVAYTNFLVIYALPIAVFKIGIIYLFGLYHRVRRYASITTLHKLIQAVTISSVGIVMMLYLIRAPSLPRSVFVIDWLLCIIFLGGIRFFHRSLQEIRLYATMPETAKQVLIAGAGDIGELLVREMLKNRSRGFLPIGFVDDDPTKQRMHIHGVRVLGGTNDLHRILNLAKVDEVIIAMPSASREVKKRIVSECETNGIRCRTIPGIYELIDGQVGITQIRDVDVEDILGREPVKMKLEEISMYLSGKSVLVTGAGGSIGSELCRQVAVVKPSSLILIDQSENDLFKIDRKLRNADPSLNVVPIIEDITNANEIDQIVGHHRPEVIFHAAAYKHVPMLELNPEAALLNNFIGTKIVAEAALKYDAKKFILISTDKAIEPTNVMGSSKTLAELEIKSLADKGGTNLIIVRFGNVLGSSGSVVPIFREQISKGGPVTVTHPEMERYFMTIPEAVQLVIQAGAMGQGGEVFVLDMGEQVKIKDLAENMIRLSGFEPGQDIAIEYIGIRPGEKLKEELFAANEQKTNTNHEKIFLARNQDVDVSKLRVDLVEIEKHIRGREVESVLKLAKAVISAYNAKKNDDDH